MERKIKITQKFCVLCLCVFNGGGLSGRMSTNYGAKSAFVRERETEKDGDISLCMCVNIYIFLFCFVQEFK